MRVKIVVRSVCGLGVSRAGGALNVSCVFLRRQSDVASRDAFCS